MMNFGQAIEAAKSGKKVARTGWNGSGMFAYIVPAMSYPPSTQVMQDYFKGLLVPYRAYWALKTAQNDGTSNLRSLALRTTKSLA